MNIFRTKNVSLDKTEMHRHLKLWDLILLGIGAMVGTGVFTITGTAAASLAGPALVISIVISALCVGLSALFFAEFASRIPATGGAYSYLYAILGEFPAWLAGWLTMMEFMTAISGVASGWAAYFKGLLLQYGISLPQALNGTFNPQEGTFVDLLPILVLLCVTSLVLLNAKAVLRFNSLLVILKFSALALFVLVGIWHIKLDNWSDFAPYGFGQIYGSSTGIMAGASLMFFGSISMAVDEVKKPQKNIPRGIVLSLLIVTILYALVTLVLTGIVHYSHLNVDDAVAYSLRSIGISWAANYVSLVAILTLITVCISMTYALSRMIYSLARDGLLPATFKKLTKTSKIPKNATILTGLSSAIAAGIFPLASIAALFNFCILAYLIMLPYGLIKLRKEKGMPGKGEFKTPLVPLLPILSIVICLSFMLQYNAETWLAFFIALLVACFIYFTYGYKHSSLEVIDTSLDKE